LGSGYVLNFSNQSFQSFVYEAIRLDIYNQKYSHAGESKAKRFKALLEIESDTIAGKLIEELLLYYTAQVELKISGINPYEQKLYEQCLQIAYKLQGKKVEATSNAETVDDFLKKELDEVSVNLLKLDSAIGAVIENRIIEVKQCLIGGSSLAGIFLCGSILEGILLGVATKNAMIFNQSSQSPKDRNQNVKPLHEWTLNSLINVGHDTGFLGLDVKKYSHALRDFRNYIHPYAQVSSGFNPDMHTFKISWHVLKAAMYHISQKVI
jgi:hypothetical protein